MTTDSSHARTPAQLPAGTGPGPRKGFLAALGLANFTIWIAFFTPVVLTLPLRVAHFAPHNKATAESIVLLCSSVFGLIANPLSGRLSDRTTSRFGMRKPWLLLGMAIGFAGLMIMAVAPSLLLLTVGSCIGQIGFATCVTIILSLLPEQVPDDRRGQIGAVLGVGQALAIVIGSVIGAGLTGSVFLAFAVPGCIGWVGVIVLCVLLRDRVLSVADRPAVNVVEIVKAFWRNPIRYPDFGWAWGSRFLLFMAQAAIINYLVFYLGDQLHLTNPEKYVGPSLAVQVVTVVLSSIISGRISDRVGRRKPFVFAAALIVVIGLSCIALATTLPVFLIGMAIGGIGQGTYLAVDLALVSEVLPDKEHDAAKDFGIMAVANQLPQLVSPAIAPLFLAIGFGSVVANAHSNYTALFVGSAVFAVLSAVAISRVKGIR